MPQQYLDKDLLNLEAVFVRKAELETYLIQLRTQMEGKDRNEFSDYSILERKFILLQDKYRGFATQLDIDYPGCVGRIREQIRRLLVLTVAYFA